MTLSAMTLRAVSICDVDLPHQSNISDDEDYRFQLPVSTMGYEQGRHSGGTAFHWGAQTVLLRQAVHCRLVNVGAASLVRGSATLVCTVCLVSGQSRSPFSSPADRDRFVQDHTQRCGKPVQPIGFFTDIQADALCIQNCQSREAAYSITEALRQGASTVLGMELEDLHVLAIARPGSESVDVLLYDPLPGGSGLLEQMVARWADVVGAALNVAAHCQSQRKAACVDCFLNFRNAHDHRYLNRHTAQEKLQSWGDRLVRSHDIPPQLPNIEATSGAEPVNDAESRLQEMLKRAGFPNPIAQKTIDLGKPLGSTTPDFFYDDPNDLFDGICIDLDGMSKHLHGNSATQQRDRQIRETLNNQEYRVIEIPVGSLDDRQAMANHFHSLGRILLGKERAKSIRDNPGISLERVTRARDNNLWSARITQGLRAIVYKDGDTWALMYAGQHDDAYGWAASRRIELNARTGALQIVEFTETIEERLAEKVAGTGLFEQHDDNYLLSLGLPPSWLPVIRKLVMGDDLFSIIDKLPEEVAERLLKLNDGELVTPPLFVNSDKPGQENEDTQRRFITVNSSNELARMLDAPFATWVGFLHPSQRKLATGSFKGPVKVTGSAGTGKTVVTMHRARHLARQGKRVLLTSFVSTLCDNIARNLKLLCSEEELANITVVNVASQAGQILKQGKLRFSAATDQELQQLIQHNLIFDCPLDLPALWLEWKFVI